MKLSIILCTALILSGCGGHSREDVEDVVNNCKENGHRLIIEMSNRGTKIACEWDMDAMREGQSK